MSEFDRLTDPATMPGMSFEEQTYEVSRRLAALDRRSFLGGSMALLAASALTGVPSWNFTPDRNLKRQVVGPVCAHSVASDGTNSRFFPRAIRPS